MPLESDIRDRLAGNLGVLEEGLTFVEKEHKLPNEVGGKGTIDILARDQVGKFVIIELKRSDAAARQALFEILKYMPLFRKLHGIGEHEIRCLIVSTTWHELLVPYSEFRRVCETQTEPDSHIDVDEEGNVTAARKVTDVVLESKTSPFDTHCIFLYELAATREVASGQICDALENSGATGYLLFHLDYKGGEARVIYPFAAYVVPTRLLQEVNDDVYREAFAELSETEDAPLPENIKSLAENTYLARLSELMIGFEEEGDSTFEIGYPDKFTAMTEEGWEVLLIDRVGPYSSALLMPDKEVVSLVKGVAGSNSIRFERLTKPSNKLDWADVSTAAEYCLNGNPVWQHGYRWFLQKVEREFPDGMVLVRIYNPLNLPETLYHFALENDPRYVPMFVVFTLSKDGTRKEGALGTIAWDGQTIPQSTDQVFGELCEGVPGYYFQHSTHSAWMLDKELMRRHGLWYSFSWVGYGPKSVEELARISFDDSGIASETVPTSKPPSLKDFIDSAQSYLGELFAEIDRSVGR